MCCCLTVCTALSIIRSPSSSMPCAESSPRALPGEVFSGLWVEEGQNDGAALLDALAKDPPSANCPALASPADSIPAILSALRGPWALVYWQAAAQSLWFGRDAVGMPLPASP